MTQDPNDSEGLVAGMALGSWVCPLVAWISQFLVASIFRGMPGMTPFYMLMMIVQFGLISAGLYLGVKVLSKGQKSISVSAWWSALLGVVLSGGTMLLIVGAAVIVAV